MVFIDCEKLENDLMEYYQAVGEGKHFEILEIEIRHKIDHLNSLIDLAIDEKDHNLNFLINICYHYYRLLAG